MAVNGHTSNVNSIVQINANQMATCSADKTIKVWDVTSKTLINTYNGHTAAVTGLLVLPGGLLASGAADSTILLWNMQTQKMRVGLNLPAAVTSMILSPYDNSLAINMASLISFYDSTTLLPIQSYITGASYQQIAIVPTNGILLGVGSNLDIWNTTGSMIFTQSVVTIYSITILPDNATTVVGRSDGLIMLFNVDANTFGASYTAHSNRVAFLTMTPDSLYLMSVGLEQKILSWQWSTMSLTQ
jgi:WD40 repeat protein